MLDFYLIADDQPRPKDPGKSMLVYAGGLEDDTFHNLQKKGVIDERFDYYSDFRWGTELIEQIKQSIWKKNLERDTDVQKLMELLHIAEENGSGLMAYGD